MLSKWSGYWFGQARPKTKKKEKKGKKKKEKGKHSQTWTANAVESSVVYSEYRIWPVWQNECRQSKLTIISKYYPMRLSITHGKIIRHQQSHDNNSSIKSILRRLSQSSFILEYFFQGSYSPDESQRNKEPDCDWQIWPLDRSEFLHIICIYRHSTWCSFMWWI